MCFELSKTFVLEIYISNLLIRTKMKYVRFVLSLFFGVLVFRQLLISDLVVCSHWPWSVGRNFLISLERSDSHTPIPPRPFHYGPQKRRARNNNPPRLSETLAIPRWSLNEWVNEWMNEWMGGLANGPRQDSSQ